MYAGKMSENIQRVAFVTAADSPAGQCDRNRHTYPGGRCGNLMQFGHLIWSRALLDHHLSDLMEIKRDEGAACRPLAEAFFRTRPVAPRVRLYDCANCVKGSEVAEEVAA
jgi:hypothetical protein